MSKTRSILLQVAFKEAATASLGTEASVEQLTEDYYNILLNLHDKFNLSVDDEGRGRSGGYNSGPRQSTAKPTPASVVTFTDANGTTWNDFRAAKVAEEVVAKHPDFKTTDNQTSVWAFKKDGSENEQAIELAAAADAMSDLAAPFGN